MYWMHDSNTHTVADGQRRSDKVMLAPSPTETKSRGRPRIRIRGRGSTKWTCLRLFLRLSSRSARSGTSPSSVEQGAADMETNKTETIEVENVNIPGSVRRVDAGMYKAMKRAFLTILPKTSPGMTHAEIRERLLAHLPETLFPGGAKVSWWHKTVQLDLEAKGVIAREKS